MAKFTDVSFPNVARVYDALLGGKSNFESDRAVMEIILKAVPDAQVAARQNRAFVGRAVRFLVTEMGVRQFLDIGSGLPTAENVHEVAQSLAPESRVVYVDNNPVVTSHAHALLISKPEGACGYVDSDIRDIGVIIGNATATLDFDKPVAVMLNAILHFIPDTDDPWGITRRLMAAAPAGSYLVLSHATGEQVTSAAYQETLNEAYAHTEAGGVTPRPLARRNRRLLQRAGGNRPRPIKPGVLKPAFRTPGGQRRYRWEDIGRLRGNLPVRSLREDVSTEEIIRLRDTGNLAWKEIGQKFGMSGEGVRRRYHKARRDGPQSEAPAEAKAGTTGSPARPALSPGSGGRGRRGRCSC